MSFSEETSVLLGLKARYILAQGNALGKCKDAELSPERAIYLSI